MLWSGGYITDQDPRGRVTSIAHRTGLEFLFFIDPPIVNPTNVICMVRNNMIYSASQSEIFFPCANCSTLSMPAIRAPLVYAPTCTSSSTTISAMLIGCGVILSFYSGPPRNTPVFLVLLLSLKVCIARLAYTIIATEIEDGVVISCILHKGEHFQADMPRIFERVQVLQIGVTT